MTTLAKGRRRRKKKKQAKRSLIGYLRAAGFRRAKVLLMAFLNLWLKDQAMQCLQIALIKREEQLFECAAG